MSASPLESPTATTATRRRPRLVFFYSERSGKSRRAEGFLAQVLQHRQNHDTFDLIRVSIDQRPDLAKKFRIEEVPTLCVIENARLRRRITAPRGCRQLEHELTPWLH